MKIYASGKSGEDFFSAFFLTIFLFRTVISQHINRAFFSSKRTRQTGE